MKKNFLITVLSLVCIMCMSCVLAACDNTEKPSGGAHAHSYVWVDNGDGTHKQHCSVAGCDLPDKNSENHVWGTDGKCEKCKAEKPDNASHNHDYKQKHDETEHWLQCDVAGCTEKTKDRAAHDTNGENGKCSVCGYKEDSTENPPTPPIHNHNWSSDWQSNDTHHWHNCTADDCTVTDNSQKDGYAEHDFSNGNCVCGKKDPSAPTEGLVYTPNKDNASYSVKGSDTVKGLQTIIIASEYENKPVTNIEDSAFESYTSLTSITIPESVKSIGNNAFKGCHSLTGVTIPNSVTNIGDYAFSHCMKLGKIEIPNSVKSIGDCAFNDCSALKNVTLGTGLTSIGNYAFNACLKITGIEVPDSVKNMGNGVFNGCPIQTAIIPAVAIPSITNDNLQAVTITSGTFIRSSAFITCSKLTSVSISDSITNIEYMAFNSFGKMQLNEYDNAYYLGNAANPYAALMAVKSASIASCKIHENTKSIFTGAFENCANLQYNEHDGAYYLGSDTNPYLALIKAKDTAITSCNVHENTKIIYANAFRDCSSLLNITISDGVTSIGDFAFRNCTRLSSIELPNGIKYIAFCSLDGCSSLESVTIPDSVTDIGNHAFCGCSGLESITIPSSVTNIGRETFMDCGALTGITIPSSVKSIGSEAFKNCSSLTSVTIPSNVTSIGSNLFEGCPIETAAIPTWMSIPKTALKSLVITGGNKLAKGAFRNCSTLTSVTLPDSMTSIDSDVFIDCPIETATIPAFALVNIANPALKTVVITSGDSIKASTFKDCKELTSITISDSVTDIRAQAFYNCTKLTSITFRGTIEQWNAITKGNYWDKNTGEYTVTCSDGKLDKNGNEITD